MNKVRHANLRLLRHSVFNTDQTTFAKTLNIAQSKLSLLEHGNAPLLDKMARSIEKSYNLPVGWMDRNNSDFFLGSEEFELVKNIRKLSLDKQKIALTLLDGFVKLLNSEHL